MKLISVLLITFVLALTTAFSQTRSEIRADMTGAGKGKTVFKTRGVEAELQFEAERLARNTSYTLSVGAWSQQVTTDALGRARLSLRFSSSNRPFIQAGMKASLVGPSGSVVISGFFVQVR